MSASEEQVTETAEQSAGESSDSVSTGATGDAEQPSISELDADELRAFAEELQTENRRLRAEYARAKRSEYRRSAVALVTLGVLAVAGAVLFQAARDLLLILGGVGLFGGVLTWFLTPERLITMTVGQSVYESVAETGNALREELGLEEANIYVPVSRSDADSPSVRLFVPQFSEYELPEEDELSSLFVLPESETKRGVSLRPTGARLVQEFEESINGTIATKPDLLADQLVDALVEQFELVDEADPEVDTASQRISVGISDGAYDDTGAFDHPVASFLGSGVATGLGQPTTVETVETDDRTVVTCRW